MNKTEFSLPMFALSPASKPDHQPARRLIVLVPEAVTDTALAAQKIWELADALESRIQLLGLSKDAEHEPGIRRQLVTLSAMLEGGNIPVESKIEFGSNWLNVVKPERREGDVIVCFAEQRSGIARKPLSQILESNLNAEIYILAGFQPKEILQLPGWVSSTLTWAGSIAIIFVFFWLQSRLIQPSQNWTHTAMLYISLIVESGSIWAWNNLFE